MSSEPFCINALREHFPTPAYAVLDHVRSHTGYGGRERTIDAVVMGLWPSRGIELWGIEIKSSRSDWQRELRDPAKAERLFAEFDRFFLFTGDLKVATLEEIPEPWGWMAIGPKGRIVTKKAAPLNPHAEATSRRFLASLMRKVTEDIEAQQRQKAFEAGYAKGRIDASKLSDHSAYGRLIEKVEAFEAASGINIDTCWSIDRIGRAAKLIRDIGIENVVRGLENQSALCRRAAGEIDAALLELREEVAPLHERAS